MAEKQTHSHRFIVLFLHNDSVGEFLRHLLSLLGIFMTCLSVYSCQDITETNMKLFI